MLVRVTAVEKNRSVAPRLVVKEARTGPAVPTQLADCRDDVDVSCTEDGRMSVLPMRPLHTNREGVALEVEVRNSRLHPSRGSPLFGGAGTA